MEARAEDRLWGNIRSFREKVSSLYVFAMTHASAFKEIENKDSHTRVVTTAATTEIEPKQAPITNLQQATYMFDSDFAGFISIPAALSFEHFILPSRAKLIAWRPDQSSVSLPAVLLAAGRGIDGCAKIKTKARQPQK